jgi:cytochrome b subunit of formate dehydrogenase
VVSTEAICAGAETSNLTSDITSSDFTVVTFALIWFLAPYCCISFAEPLSLRVGFLVRAAVPRKASAQYFTRIRGELPRSPRTGNPAVEEVFYAVS